MSVVVRIPPSPTGYFHVGRARTALFNYLFAKKHGGRIIFRFEDTDRERSKTEYEQDIVESLGWLGITYDEGPTRQSERTPVYKGHLDKMIAEGTAYISHETEGANREVVRFKNPNATITFHDLIRGDISFDTTELGDFIIARNINEPLYHLAVVVDDYVGGITHVIRGDDGISNAPRQILLQEAIGAARPVYAHMPMILGPDKSKMSARHGATSLRDFREEGFLPEAMVNYLALLGWHPEDDREYFSLPELVEAFELERVQKSGAVWDRDKLLSVNQHWMRKLPDTTFLTHVGLTKSNIEKAVPLLKERARTFGEARALLEGELKCLFEEPVLDKNTLISKEPADRPGLAKTALEALLEAVNGLAEGVSAEAVKDTLMPMADAEEAKGKGGRGGVLWPLRYALSGQERSPDPFTLIAILGRKEATSRVQKAIDILGE